MIQLEAIKINEWGAYAQVTKKLFHEKLSLSASGRYDKNENFEGKFTPRVTALLSVAKGHNLRFSYQTAYKFPTTQQQWIQIGCWQCDLIRWNAMGERLYEYRVQAYLYI